MTTTTTPLYTSVTNYMYGAELGRVLVQSRASNKYAWVVFEAANGRYYVADTGDTLHIDPHCGALWYSSNVRIDPTQTLAYRIFTRGRAAEIRNEEGGPIVRVCENCATKHRVVHKDLR